MASATLLFSHPDRCIGNESEKSTVVLVTVTQEESESTVTGPLEPRRRSRRPGRPRSTGMTPSIRARPTPRRRRRFICGTEPRSSTPKMVMPPGL